MRNLKKFLALALAMVMAMSLMVSANALHAGTQYGDETDVTPAFDEAVQVLTGMGVYSGDSGSFKPAANITRAEVAALIYRLVTGDTTDAQKGLYDEYPYGGFTDIPRNAWYGGYVGYCANAGLIKGRSATTFDPAGDVTGYEVLAMILRAIGYDRNGEFTGADWRVNVSATAQQLGILTNVKTTQYGGTLYLPARRDVVADLLFQTAAYVHMVNYTPAFGYQPYGDVVTNTGNINDLTGGYANDTLGYKVFGLTKRTGIVVGNQATGETRTLVSYATANTWDGGALTKVELTGGVSYLYDSIIDPNNSSAGSYTISYKFNTGLDLFGHKVNVWYNNNTASGSQQYNSLSGFTQPTNYGTTYAVIDKASLVKTVWADDKDNDDPVANKTSVYSAAVKAGFSELSAPAWESDRFCQIGADADQQAIQSKVGMYRIISNNSNLTADVVISLNQEVATIAQVNTTVKDGEYIFLDSGNSKFGVGLVTPTTSNGKLLDALLAPGSDKTLGDVVTVNQIVGTTPIRGAATLTGLVTADNTTRTVANAASLGAHFCRYETTKLEPAFTGTVATYALSDAPTNTSTKNVMKVTLTNGESYELSGITGSNINETNASPYPSYQWNFDASYSHLVDGAIALTGDNTYAGVTYSFYLDEVGRFIGVVIPNDYKFLYTTFADYEIGGLGTGTSGYYVYGVDWNGSIVKDKQIVSITEPVDATPKFDDLTASVSAATYPAGTNSLAVGYNYLPVTLKDLGNAATNPAVVGNQIREGVNTRFMVDPDGNMTWYPESSEYGQRFLGWWNTAGTPAASYTWTITKGDVANGFKRVYNHNVAVANPTNAIAAPASVADNTDYLLTDTTKFIVVTGSGTADLKVDIYNGIGDLVGNASYAEISIKNDFKGDNVYFLTSAQRYGNVNTSDNHTIDTVILSNTNLNNYTNQNLFFSKPGNKSTGVKLAGSVPGSLGAVNQYELYNNGVKGYYWVSDTLSTGNATNANTANGTTAKGDFYTLTPVGEVNGQTIYKATVQAYSLTADICDVNELYDYIVVNELSTAAFGGTTAAGHPGNVVKKVSDAKVTVVLGDNEPTVVGAGQLFPDGINITDVQTLNNAVSMGKPGNSGNLYDVYVAFEYDGINVTNIYVTNIQLHT